MLSRSLLGLAIVLTPWCWTGPVRAAKVIPQDQAADPAPASLEARLSADLADQKLDEFTLFEAVLVAGGVSDPKVLRQHNLQLADWLEVLRSATAGRSSRVRAQRVFEFMHRRILASGFQQDQTQLSAALDSGHFNCVSSTVLFLALARGCGLEVEAVAEPGHVYCRLHLEQGPLDVQTTDPRAFDGAPSDRVASPRMPRPLGAKGILALVYYNAGVERLARREFPQALEANERAVRLDPAHVEARANLLATYNNWAVDCVRGGRYRDAIGLMCGARALAPTQPQLSANLRTIFQQWAAEHAHAGRHKEALSVLDEGLTLLPGDGVLVEARHAVERRWLRARERLAPQP